MKLKKMLQLTCESGESVG